MILSIFNDNSDFVKSVNNVDPFVANGYSLLAITGYDPIVLDNQFLLNKNRVVPPVGLTPQNTVPTTFGDSASQEFTMLRNGEPQSLIIRVGHTTNNAPLIGKVMPLANMSLTVNISRLDEFSLGDLKDTTITAPANNNLIIRSGNVWVNMPATALGAAYKTALESLTGGARLSATAVKDIPGVPTVTGVTDGYILTKQGTGYAWLPATATTSIHTDDTISGNNTLGSPLRVTYPLTSANSQKLTQLQTNRQLPALNTGSAGQVPKLQADGSTVEWADDQGAGDVVNLNDIEDFAKVAKHDRVPRDKLPSELQDFTEALSGNEGWQDDGSTVNVAGQVSNAFVTGTPTLTSARTLVYGEYYANPAGFLQDNRTFVVRIPTNQLSGNQFRLVVEGAPGDRDPDVPYGEIYPSSGWTRLGVSGSYTYYYQTGIMVPGLDRLYVQRFNRIIIDTSKVDNGYAPWAGKNNSDTIPQSKLPNALRRVAIEMVNQVRGISIAATSTAVNTSLTPFTRQLTLGSTDHGVFFTAIQANVHSGSTSQLALDMTTISLDNLSYMSVLRSGNAYDNSAGSVGNGLLVGTFDVNNTSGVKQGTINCYIARNSSNQVGTYNSYVPESGASSSLSGQIVIDWEVSLLRTDSSASGGGGGFTQAQVEEFARDAIAAAVVAGGGNVTAINHDQQNEIILNVKAGSLTPATIARDSTDNTKASMLSVWQTLFGITSAPAVPQPVTLPVLFVTRQATDPADVVTIRDTRGYLNETHLVGTTFNLFKGGTASAQTALSGNPYTIKARLSGGFKQATQRVQLNKNVTFTSSASPVSVNMFNADVYYMVIGTRATDEANNFHLYDDAESFVASGNTSVRGVAYNPVRNFISTIDGGTTKRHQAYLATGGGTPIAVYTQNLEGDPKYCAWDPDGRYLYVAEDESFKVYDFGASTNPSTLTISRVTSKEFSVANWFKVILGIKVTATEVLIYGKRYSTSTSTTIDRFSKSGTRATNESDIFILSGYGVGLESTATGSRHFIVETDGNNVGDFTPVSRPLADNYFESYSFRFRLDSGDNSSQAYAIIQDRFYRRKTSSMIEQIDIPTMVPSTHALGTVIPSGKTVEDMFSAGNYLYVLSTERIIYRSDQSQSSPTNTALTGTITATYNFYARYTILNNKLYAIYLSSSRWKLISYPLTGSVASGYTAIGNVTQEVADIFGENAASSAPGITNDGSNVFVMGRLHDSNIYLAKITVANNNVNRLFDRSWTGGVGLFFDPIRRILHYKWASWPFTNAAAIEQTNIISGSRSSTTTFPLGSRQSTPSGIGYNDSSDKFYLASNQRVNVYDKRVTGAVKTWLHDSVFDITTNAGNAQVHLIKIVGNRLYMWSIARISIYSYPNLVAISSTSLASGANDNKGFYWNGSFYIQTGTRTIREFSPTTGEFIGNNINLGDSFRGFFLADEETNRLFTYSSTGRLTTYPLPATGKITATTLTPTTVGSTSYPTGYNYPFFERNGFIYNFSTSSAGRMLFAGYDKNTGARNTDEDLSLAISPTFTPRGFETTGDRLYATTGSSSPFVAVFVRAV